MFRTLALMSVFFAPSVFASNDFAPNYWEKNYGSNGGTAVYYSVSIQVKDLAKAAADADRRITKLGGALNNMNSSGDAAGRQSRTFNYSLDAKTAESAAKGFFDMGDLVGYSVSRNSSSKDGDEMREKLKQISDELEANREALAKMPIASYFLSTKAAQLKQSLANFEGGGGKATLGLTLISEAKAKK